MLYSAITKNWRGLLIDAMAYMVKIPKSNNTVWHWHSNITNNSNYNRRIDSSNL